METLRHALALLFAFSLYPFNRWPALFSFLHLCFDRLLEPGKASLKERFPVYENCGCSLNVCLGSAGTIPVDERRYRRVFEILVKLFHFQAKTLRDFLHLRIAEILLVCK